MVANKIIQEKVKYINIEYLLRSFYNLNSLDEISCKIVKDKLIDYSVSEGDLVIIDLENVDVPSHSIIDSGDAKKSQLFYTFEEYFKNLLIDFIFVNSSKIVSDHIIEKDFPNRDNIFIISYNESEQYCKCSMNKSDISKEIIGKKWEYLSSFNLLDSRENLKDFIDILISNRIKFHIGKNGCKQMILEDIHGEHILKSTPVHVNMYINIKPIIENYYTFNEICFYISKRILEKMWNNFPDYIIASSKNSKSIASGVLYYLKNCDLIIINQVSPITAYNSYSNVLSVKPNKSCAIIEDFYCMGTEVKEIKGILWSQGMDVDKNVATFPVASTNIYDLSKYSFDYHKIYPLFKLDEDYDYLIFTNNSCPICNKITQCEHKSKFSINYTNET